MWRFFVEDLIRFGQLGHRLYVIKERPDGTGFSVQKPTCKARQQYESIGYEDAFLDDGSMPESDVKAFLQAASDAAWEIGIKPKQLENAKNELSAVRYHLEDMRQLAGVKK